MRGIWQLFAACCAVFLAVWNHAEAGPLIPDASGRPVLAVYTRGVFQYINAESVTGEQVCGGIGDIPVPGNYLTGMLGRFAVWSPSFGIWRICGEDAGLVRSWGVAGDLPAAEDYNGDGLTEYAVFRPSTGEWFIQLNTGGIAGGSVEVVQFGLPGDVPAAADYDGDLRSEIAVFRQDRSTGGAAWLRRQPDGTAAAPVLFGLLGDLPQPNDYNGDGRDEPAVWRPSDGAWYVQQADGTAVRTQFGLPGDIPSALDFDNDGKADLAVYRPSLSRWFVRGSSDERVRELSLGATGALAASDSRTVFAERPASLDFNGDRLSDLAVVRRESSGALRFLLHTGTAQIHPGTGTVFGAAPAVLCHGDYDGDAKTDLCTAAAEEGYFRWRFLLSGSQTEGRRELIVTYGLDGDQLVPADYDGDRITDLAVVRNMPDGLKLWIPNNSGSTDIEPVTWGFMTDRALTADMDGDGRSDYIVVRPSGGELLWLVRTAAGQALPARLFGFVDDELVLGDFNGDGAADLGVIRQVNGAKLVIIDGLAPYFWGLPGDTSLTGNFGGPHGASSAVYRVVNGQGFFFIRSSAGGLPTVALGAANDVPVDPSRTAAIDASGSGGGGGGGGTTPDARRITCATTAQAAAAEQGFLWQPADTDGRLLVRFPARYAGDIARVGLAESRSDSDVVLETLTFSAAGADERPTYRGARAGGTYPQGVILIRQDTQRENHCVVIPNPAQQYGT